MLLYPIAFFLRIILLKEFAIQLVIAGYFRFSDFKNYFRKINFIIRRPLNQRELTPYKIKLELTHLDS